MAPIGPNENPWVVMTEYTADNGCQDVAGHGSATSSDDSLTDYRSGSNSEYVTSNETSPGGGGAGCNKLVVINIHAQPQSQTFNPHRLPQDRTDARGPNVLGHDIGVEHPPKTQSHEQDISQTRMPPSVLDPRPFVPRTFPDPTTTSGLSELFPHLFEGKPNSKVEEWVQICNRYGAGLPRQKGPGGGQASNENQDNEAADSNGSNSRTTKIDTSNKRNVPELTTRPGTEHRQIQTQKQNNEESGTKDAKDDKKKTS